MEEQKLRIPIGVENFEKLRTNDYYYVDKTGLIRELLTKRPGVTVFTRPRRFGKTLTMKMLTNFFSNEGDKHIFDGLEISEEKALCKEHMGKHPVIFLTLKGIGTSDFERSYRRLVQLITEVAGSFYYLLDSDKLNQQDKLMYNSLLDKKMDESTLCSSLKNLCKLLKKHFGKKPVLLIDEYDVPLNKAYQYGYYDNMTELIRDMLGEALKSNDNMEFAVLTGCLRISKESIFTGLNNLAVFSVTDDLFDSYFGFTDEEVRIMLEYYGFSDCYDSVKEWYDGYQFGNTKLYCPWDVLNHCIRLQKNPHAEPKKYWINTSGNDAIMQFISMADRTTREEIDKLLDCKPINKKICEELTYQEMYSDINNLWSLLYATGYLTQCGKSKGGMLKLVIPNKEIYTFFNEQIYKYFLAGVKADTDNLNAFCNALKNGDADTAEEIFTKWLKSYIGVRNVSEKECFYHTLLLGILRTNGSWKTMSNQEAGEGYADILSEADDEKTGIVIEMKYAPEKENLEKACKDALKQINDRRYMDFFYDDEVRIIRKYGFACSGKSCKVMLETEEL